MGGRSRSSSCARFCTVSRHSRNVSGSRRRKSRRARSPHAGGAPAPEEAAALAVRELPAGLADHCFIPAGIRSRRLPSPSSRQTSLASRRLVVRSGPRPAHEQVEGERSRQTWFSWNWGALVTRCRHPMVPRVARSRPRSRSRPVSGERSPARSAARVDFPPPERPSSKTRSPSRSSMAKSCTAGLARRPVPERHATHVEDDAGFLGGRVARARGERIGCARRGNRRGGTVQMADASPSDVRPDERSRAGDEGADCDLSLENASNRDGEAGSIAFPARIGAARPSRPTMSHPRAGSAVMSRCAPSILRDDPRYRSSRSSSSRCQLPAGCCVMRVRLPTTCSTNEFVNAKRSSVQLALVRCRPTASAARNAHHATRIAR